MPAENERIIEIIRQFSTDHIFERKQINAGIYSDEYRQNWLDSIGNPHSGERISKLTVSKICEHVKRFYPDIQPERTISNTGLAFDIYFSPTYTAFEICLGAVTKEFHKDVLKGMLDQNTHTSIFMFREYKFGKKDWILGKKWFDQPAQKELINLIAIHKLKVIPTSLRL